MTLRPLFPLAALMAGIAFPMLAQAQEPISASEEQRLEALARENAEIYVPKSHVTIGFRMLNSGGMVKFGNLGTVAFDSIVAPRSDGIVARVYDNGAVHTDSPRLGERDENNVQTSIPGGRYPTLSAGTVNVTDANGNVIGTEDTLIQTGDFLAYTPGLTRNWGYGASSQVTADGRIAMSTYSSTSEGGAAAKKEGISAGLEMQFIRTFSRSTDRLQWGVMTGISLNGINSKTTGTVTSTLNIRTDYYSLNGQAAPPLPITNVTDANGNVTGTTIGQFTAPTYVDYTASNGAVIQTNGLETTVPLAAVPDGSTVATTIPGGIVVKGLWKIKGAYFMVRLGPSLRMQVTERLGLNASLGIAGAYVGSTYSVNESFEVPDVPGVLVGAIVGTETTTATKFIGGYFADMNLEWAANERTGLFGGITAQKLGNYNQSVGGRTANVDIGGAVGLRAGVSIRF
jgi:hypothetical protein